jgi:hypothetical protein
MGKLTNLYVLVFLMVLLPLASLGGCQREQEPATLKYRDHLEMGIGECKEFLVGLDKSDSWLENREVVYTLGMLEDDELKPLSESIEVGMSNYANLGDDNMAKFQGTIIGVKTSPRISPGEYKLGMQLEVEGMGVIGLVPLTISVIETADDIFPTPGGPAYRAQVHGPDMEEWPSVEEQTVALGIHGVQLEYRDFVEMETGQCKGILFTLHTAGTELENKKVNYTVGVIEGDMLAPLPEEPLEIVEMWTYDSPPHQLSPVTVILIGTDCRMSQPEEFNLGVQLEAEGMGVIGLVPLTINVIETADDIFGTPGGPAYRAHVLLSERPVSWSPDELASIAETRVELEKP